MVNTTLPTDVLTPGWADRALGWLRRRETLAPGEVNQVESEPGVGSINCSAWSRCSHLGLALIRLASNH